VTPASSRVDVPPAERGVRGELIGEPYDYRYASNPSVSPPTPSTTSRWTAI